MKFPKLFRSYKLVFAIIIAGVIYVYLRHRLNSSSAFAAKAVSPSSMKFRGGKIFPNGKMQIIFWGNTWNTQTDQGVGLNMIPSKATLYNAYAKLFASTYFDKLRQYGINRPVLLPAAVSVYNTGKSCKQSPWIFAAGKPNQQTMYYNANVCGDYQQSVPSIIQDAITKRLVADYRKDPNVFYLVIAGPGYGWTRPVGNGVRPAGGLHGLFDWNGKRGYYAIVNNATTPPATLSDIYAGSHEVVEVLTNPDWQHQGWTADTHLTLAAPLGDEMADVCSASPANTQQNFLVNGFPAYPYWSNSDNGCVVPGGILPNTTLGGMKKI